MLCTGFLTLPKKRMIVSFRVDLLADTQKNNRQTSTVDVPQVRSESCTSRVIVPMLVACLGPDLDEAAGIHEYELVDDHAKLSGKIREGVSS